MTGPRDWDKEMAEIDKVIASGKAPPLSNAPALPAATGSSRGAVAAGSGALPTATRHRDKFAVWFRALLGVAGAAALPFWPYGKSCGLMLYLYLLATLAISVVGAWTMRGAWTHRRGVAHTVGLLVLLGGLSFAAIEILQRTGYAAVRLGWTCP
jgi:hypothetical protein